MQEQEISDRIHGAFDVDPPDGGFDRLRIALDSKQVQVRPGPRVVGVGGWAPVVAALVAVVIAASLLAYAVETRQSAVTSPPRPALALLPVIDFWAYSGVDLAIQLPAPSGGGQTGRTYVLMTHDGGKSWFRTPLDEDRINLRWIDSRHLVATMDDVGPPFQVASSADGGATWRITTMPLNASSSARPPYQIGSMFFLNDHEGWEFCGEFGQCGSSAGQTVLYHTLDAGADWQQISTLASLGGVVPLSIFFFTDSMHGFMSTLSDGPPVLLSTIDGGKTWREISLPAPSVEVGGVDASAIDCGSATCVLDPTLFGMNGVLTVIRLGHAPYTLTTEDGGLTWSSPHSMPFASPTAMPTPWLAPLNAREWWTVDASGSLYKTLDAGVTWQRVAATLPRDYELDSVQPGENGVLWGATRYARSGPFPLRSTDGGLTWSLVKLPKP